jgi:hypothetical protein
MDIKGKYGTGVNTTILNSHNCSKTRSRLPKIENNLEHEFTHNLSLEKRCFHLGSITMARLELYLSLELQVVRFDGHTATILGSPDEGVAFLDLLSDETDRVIFLEAVKPVMARENAFNTLNLVFMAPGAPALAPKANRSPLNIPHATPARDGFYSGSEVQLSCFTQIELWEEEEKGMPMIKLVAIEYSREQRKDLIGKEFGNWLLHNCVENAVVVARPSGEIVFWNEHASEKYQKPLERDASILSGPKSGLSPEQPDTEQSIAKEKHDEKIWYLKGKNKCKFYVNDSKSYIRLLETSLYRSL